MNRIKKGGRWLLFCLCVILPGYNCLGKDIKILSSEYIPDKEFPHLLPYIIDGWNMKFGMGEPKAYTDIVPMGATIRLFLRNASDQAVSVDGVSLNGIDLSKHIATIHREHSGLRAASYLLNDEKTTPQEIKDKLEELGAPIWFQTRPDPAPPEGFAELVIRLRYIPKKRILQIAFNENGVKSAEISVDRDKPSRLGFSSINFTKDINRSFLYVSSSDTSEFEIEKLFIDGAEVKIAPEVQRKSRHGFLPLEIPLPHSWEHGSYHYIAAVSRGGDTASAIIRARDDFFCLGIWGYRNYGNTDEERARDSAKTFRDHLFNTHMGMGHGFFRDPEGLAMLKEMGLRLMIRDPAKQDIGNPDIYARFLLDEPDAHEHAIDDLPAHRRLGGYAQGLVERQKKWTKVDPRTLTLLNVNLTYKPENWITYGPLPDILAADPYYQSRLNDAYSKRPGMLAQVCHPYYVYAIAEVVRWASQPKPPHIILNSVSERHKDKVFRYGTPEEKRIEFYYSLAAGAKGISYWWFTPYGECFGCGSEEPEAKAMMKEMARLNAEARSILPLLSCASPGTQPGEKLDAFARCLPPWLMARTLFAGTDAALLILVNRDHGSDRVGTLFEPIPRAIITFEKPTWMKDIKTFRFQSGAIEEIPFTMEDGKAKMEIKDVSLTEIIILTEKVPRIEEIRQRWSEVQPRLQNILSK
ncbi:hypothetical protein JW926_01725 [Candidatus Sumerlaeota bacterium]|nr:hypothetical protein [Candidatus Sumerlaeota bacterium]